MISSTYLRKQVSLIRQVSRVPLARNSFIVILGDSLNIASLIVATIFLARIVDPDALATYRQVAFITLLTVSLLDLGLPVSIYTYWRRYSDEDRKIYTKLLMVATAGLGVLACVLLVCLAFPLGWAFNNRLLPAALIAASPFVLSGIAFQLVRPILISKGKAASAALLECLFTIGSWTALTWSVFLGASVADSLIIWAVVNVLRLPLAYWITRDELKGNVRYWSRNIAREVWQYAWPLHTSRLPTIVTNYADKIVGSALLAPAGFASYSLGARELPFVSRIAFSIGSVLIPEMVEESRSGTFEEIRALWRRVSLLTALMTYPIGAFCIWNADRLIQLLYTSMYEEAAVPFMAFAFLTFLRVIEYGSIAKAMAKTRVILKASLTGPVIGSLVAVPMTLYFGIVGLSLFAPLATLVVAIQFLFSYRRLLKMKIHEFFPYPKLIGLCGLAFLSCWLAGKVTSVLLPSSLGSEVFANVVGLSTSALLTMVCFYALAVSAYSLMIQGGWGERRQTPVPANSK